MKQFTILIMTDKHKKPTQFSIPVIVLRVLSVLLLTFIFASGYLSLDYYHLKNLKNQYIKVVSQNQDLKNEAKILSSNLKDVRKSLTLVEDYSNKINDFTKLRARAISKKTGIGPLNSEEAKVAAQIGENSSNNSFPLGVEIDKLKFKSVFEEVDAVERQAGKNALKLQKLLSSLSQNKSLFNAIPSVSPVKGWVTSNFGVRISPFTGKKTMHRGLDIASRMGTPIYAPADGVVIFNGAKSGFGNFIMIAHGYGVVTRYGHNSENLVQLGQKVKRGDQIATVGSTGRSTGPHLHYEVMIHGKVVNPKKLMLDIR